MRTACPDDAEGIFGVHVSNEDTEPWGDAGELRRWMEWIDGVEGAQTIVAERDGQVVGVGELWWGCDVAAIGRALDMSMLYVHRDHHGRAMTERMIEWARDSGCRNVTVWPDEGAVAFYRKVGLTPVLTLRRFRVELGGGGCATARGGWGDPAGGDARRV